jgi:hypothetical protein
VVLKIKPRTAEEARSGKEDEDEDLRMAEEEELEVNRLGIHSGITGSEAEAGGSSDARIEKLEAQLARMEEMLRVLVGTTRPDLLPSPSTASIVPSGV